MGIMKATGIAVFPKLNEPDTKFDAAGVFQTKLVMDGDEAERILAVLTPLHEEAVKEAQAARKGKRVKVQDLPVEPEYDEDGNETGNYVLKAKMKASGVSKKTGKPWSRKLPIFDAAGKPTNVRVGGGSRVVLAIEPATYESASIGVGVSLRLQAVQVISLNGGRDSSAFGFGAVEGGFVDTGESDVATEPTQQDGDDLYDHEF